MKRLFLYILPFFILALTACHSTVHEHPDAGDALVTLTMKVKTAGPEIYSVIEYSGESRVIFDAKDYRFPNSRSDISATLSQHLAKTAVDTEYWDMRLVWELYDGSRDDIRNGNATLIQRDTTIIDFNQETPYHTIQFHAPSGRYTLLAWSDFTPKGSLDDHYYDTHDLNVLHSELELRRACKNNDQRDCFSQAYDFEVSRVDFQGQERYYETTLIRPQGRYVILATDYDTYLHLSSTPVEQNDVSITYPSFINVDYSVLEEKPRDGVTGMSYTMHPRIYEFDEQTTVCVADDYSFVNGEVSYVNVNMAVYNPQGSQLSTNRNIEIPLYADYLTVIVGKFLATSKGSGGIKVDDGFEDEFIIPYSHMMTTNGK